MEQWFLTTGFTVHTLCNSNTGAKVALYPIVLQWYPFSHKMLSLIEGGLKIEGYLY